MEGICIDDDVGQRRGIVKDGYIISIIWICIEVELAVKKIMIWIDIDRGLKWFRGDVVVGKVIRARLSEKV